MLYLQNVLFIFYILESHKLMYLYVRTVMHELLPINVGYFELLQLEYEILYLPQSFESAFMK